MYSEWLKKHGEQGNLHPKMELPKAIFSTNEMGGVPIGLPEGGPVNDTWQT